MKVKAVLVVFILFLVGCQHNTNNAVPSDVNKHKNDNTTYISAPFKSNKVISTDLWEYISDGISLQQPNNSLVNIEKKRYLNGRKNLQQITYKAEPYMYWIIKEIEARNLPVEIALLPIVESAFNPHATSSAKAAGLWQIVPTTGLYYGLELNYWYDGRRDIVSSTNAALDMLERLNKIFNNDWLLTIAAYNSGEGRVLNAIKVNQAQGKPIDFWSLNLPKETSSYVPKLLALADIIKNHKQYAIALSTTDPNRVLDRIDVGEQIELMKISNLTGVSFSKLRALNAAYTHGITPPEGPHVIIIPKIYTELLRRAISKESGTLVNKISYTTKQNDTIESLAKKFRSHTDSIRQVNNIRNNRLVTGQQLSIPVYNNDVIKSLNQATMAIEKSKNMYKSKKSQYQIVSGDTLTGIAKRLSISTTHLKEKNKITNNTILKIGSILNYESNGNYTKKVAYKVANGDTMTSISKKYRLDINDVVLWNRSLPNIHQLNLGDMVTLYIR